MKQRMFVRPMRALIFIVSARLDACLSSAEPANRAHRKAAPRTRTLSLMLAVAIFASPLAVTTVTQAQQFSVIYNFTVASGAVPSGTLIADDSGKMYGLTAYGGFHGYGMVFGLLATGGEKVLYSFTGGADGSMPQFTALLRDPAGNLYGVTPSGGNSNSTCSSGCGVIFRISATTGKERVLYSFKGGADGSFPFSSLIADTAGNFYGTTGNGGNFNAPCNTYGCGVIYKLSNAGGETVLYAFTGASDGATPGVGLIRDPEGNIYGTTTAGGAYGNGVVFKLDPAGNETVLYAFTGGSDGAVPLFLVRDAAGNLYGNTEGGGDPSCFLGCGVLFKVDSSGNESTLYSFTNGPGGFEPLGELVLDSRGNLYGTTYEGGFSNSSECRSPYGCGVVFRISATGTETVLHRFDVADGASPQSGLLINNGYLYGTTVGGGSADDGVIFKIKP
jgi:uncharacterized repeat protein (TIGR03803 family)